jgi:hypothetical protein
MMNLEIVLLKMRCFIQAIGERVWRMTMIILWRMILMGDQWIVSERKGSKRSKTVLAQNARKRM